MRINPNDTLFIMIDIQEKFRDVIDSLDLVSKNSDILNRSAELMQLPILVTEQYPKGLGKTLEEIYIPASATRFEKVSFSIFNEEISSFLVNQPRSTLVLYGIETHICMYQSALDALAKGYKVYFVADAVSSRTKANKEAALNRLSTLGVNIVTTEMLLFEMLVNSKHPAFKEISKLVK